MLINAKKVKSFKLCGSDTEMGCVKEFYFDDRFWTIRYLIAETGSWLLGKKVLISPFSVKKIFQNTRAISVNLTKSQIKNSPSIDADKPFSRQFEVAYSGYHGYPYYWTGPYSWGAYPYAETNQEKAIKSGKIGNNWDPDLRSTNEVTGYHVEATDGNVGHIEDFIIDSDTWTIRHLVVDTQNWWSGKKVLVSPQWIDRVSWADQKVYVSTSRDEIKKSAEYDDNAGLNP